jgi:8-oxo-dGTP pyrophosphatase MutT (NUDIX family)
MPPSEKTSDGDGDTPIRDAACLVLIDRSLATPRMLLGRRLPTQAFLPNKWVFPGGRVDPDDRALAQIMMTSRIAEPRENAGALTAQHEAITPFALTAVRETFEETGLLVGKAPEGLAAELPPAWQAMAAVSGAPSLTLASLRPFARAITPPGFPRRFDTWFFCADWQAERAGSGIPDGELLDFGWFTLGEARALDLPIITRFIVDDVASLLAASPLSTDLQIPFYFQDKTEYRRTLMDSLDSLFAP